MMDSMVDKIIQDLFEARWHGDHVLSSLDNMKTQLAKTLKNQIEGYWSGHTAYHIAVDGGFLIDSKSGSEKKLTKLGLAFLNQRSQASE